MIRLTAIALALSAAILGGCGGGDDSSDGGTTASASASAALTQCNIDGRQQELGASYVTTIEVASVSCGQAEKVVVAYHQCRRGNGGAGGTCDTAVQGYTCTEGERQSVPGVQFNATVDCVKDDSEIRSNYTQNF